MTIEREAKTDDWGATKLQLAQDFTERNVMTSQHKHFAKFI